MGFCLTKPGKQAGKVGEAVFALGLLTHRASLPPCRPRVLWPRLAAPGSVLVLRGRVTGRRLSCLTWLCEHTLKRIARQCVEMDGLNNMRVICAASFKSVI